MDVDIRSADDLARLQRELKSMDKTLQTRMRRAITRGTKNTKQRIKSNAARLPSSGGLAARVAGSSLRTLNRVSGRNIGIRIQASSNNAGLRLLDAGRNRHKAWGREDEWYDQEVEPGFFSDAMKDTGEDARREILKEANDIARDIENAH